MLIQYKMLALNHLALNLAELIRLGLIITLNFYDNTTNLGRPQKSTALDDYGFNKAKSMCRIIYILNVHVAVCICF